LGNFTDLGSTFGEQIGDRAIAPHRRFLGGPNVLNTCIYRKVGKRVRSRRARRVYYTTSPESETEIGSGGGAYVYL